MIGYFSHEELLELGFGSLGENVLISKTSTLYNRKNIFLGNNIRIDNFCVIAPSESAILRIGNYVQISAHSFMNGMGNITLEDFTTFAPYVRLFSSTDDYSGRRLTNVTIPKEYLGTVSGDVVLEKHTIIATGSTIMPGVTLKIGTSVAAHSYVNKDSEPFTIIGGVPAKYIKERKRDLLDFEKKLLENE
jgi:acetyltransferase-like isoleucine patch superfamily enzyme